MVRINLSQNSTTLLFITALHLAVLFAMVFEYQENNNQPILSFSVTMMDISSSNNVVSSQASAESDVTSKQNEKTEIDEESLLNAQKELKESAKEDVKMKNSDKKSVNSQQQTAVLAPTTPAIFDAAYLSNVSPEYPALSRRLNEQGLVTLNVFVNEQGKAEKILIKNSSGYSRLDNAAVTTVKNWRFIAAKHHEQTVASWVQVPINFVLEKNDE